MDSRSPVVWVLTDERAGNTSQSLGVAEALGFPVIRKDIVYNPLASLPNIIRGATLIGVNKHKSDQLTSHFPDIVIAAGRKTAPIVRYIKRRSGGKALTVQLMWPGYPITGLDMIAVPAHDKGIQLPADTDTTLIATIGASHRVTAERLAEELAIWKEKMSAFPAPRIAVLIGGTTKDHAITDAHIQMLGEQLSSLISARGASLLISTSRRTDSTIVAALKKAITVECYFHEWTPEGENPYFGFLAASDVIVVTGDSMSMCSEACATGKPVYIFSPADITSSKHSRLHEQLYALGFAKPFEGILAPTWHYVPLNVAGDVAAAISRAWLKKAFAGTR